jgi:hypothetical protein
MEARTYERRLPKKNGENMSVKASTVYRHAGWTLVPWWAAANVIGFGLAAAPVFHNFWTDVPSIAALGRFEPSSAVAGAIAGAIPSFFIGFLQRSVLRRYLPLSRWWIATLAVGMALNHFISDGFPDATDSLIVLLATGALIGAAQWLVLRNQLDSYAWWMLPTVAGWSIGVWIGVSLLNTTDLLLQDWTPWISFQQHGIVAVVASVVYSAMTGLAMVWFLRRNEVNEITENHR